jgi:hypothetical protein
LRATPEGVVLSKEAEERRDADQIINRDEKKGQARSKTEKRRETSDEMKARRMILGMGMSGRFRQA